MCYTGAPGRKDRPGVGAFCVSRSPSIPAGRRAGVCPWVGTWVRPWARRLAWARCPAQSLSHSAAPRSLWRAAALGLCVLGLCVAVLAPLLVVDMPPLVDYPNHLARAFVLASLPADPVLARFYAPHWSLTPNLALDLVAPPLMHWLPVQVVGRLLIAAALLLPVLGTLAYRAALDAGEGWWALGVGFAAYNTCLLYGFLNFDVALGLALVLAAGWLRWRRNRPVAALLLGMAGAVTLFMCHLMGLVFFAALIGGAELADILPTHPDGLLRTALRRGAVLLPVFAAPAGLYAASALRGLGGDAVYLSPLAKPAQLLTVFANYQPPLDLATAALLIAIPAVALMCRRGRVPPPALGAGVLLLAGFLAAPFAWKGTYWLDTRFAVMLAFLLFAAFVPSRWPGSVRNAVAALLIVLFAARMGILTDAWIGHRADLADLRTVLAPVRPGQAVYVAEVGFDEAPAYWAANPRWRRLSATERTDEHLGALALIEHRAWWPFEFDNPSQQPLETLPPYRDLAARVGHMPHYADIAHADLCGFDVLLLQDADAMPDLPRDRFRLLARSGFAALYSILSCAPP